MGPQQRRPKGHFGKITLGVIDLLYCLDSDDKPSDKVLSSCLSNISELIFEFSSLELG